MGHPFEGWMDTVCETFGWSDDEDDASSKANAKKAVEEFQEQMKQVDAQVHDALLEQEPQQCTQPPDTSDDYVHPESVEDIPSRDELASRLRSVKARLDAVTRRVHGLLDGSPSVGGRPKDPKLAALNQKHLSVASHYNKVQAGWGGWSDRGQRLELVPLERSLHLLECEVTAYPMP